MICIFFMDLSNILYDLAIGLITGLTTSYVAYYYANVIPKRRLERNKHKQYIEIVKRHGNGLFYAYSDAHASFITFNNYYPKGEYTQKDLWKLFNRRSAAITIAVDRIMSLHTEFDTNIALISDIIPKDCAENLKKANLDYFVNQILSSYNDYKRFIASDTEKKYNQEAYDIEFKLHDSIIYYMIAMKSIEDFNKINPGLGLVFFQPMSSILI